jgi:hypothetical protein
MHGAVQIERTTADVSQGPRDRPRVAGNDLGRGCQFGFTIGA